MSRVFRRAIALRLLSLAVLILANDAVVAQTVWTGYTLSFSKADFADPTLPENQDRITDDIWITRDSSQGIFNIAQEMFFSHNSSPLGTEWAFPNNNPGATLSATDWNDFTFEDWETATGGAGGGPPSTVGQNAVLHLIDDNIYLDIRFTDWTPSANGGGFSYLRAEPPPVLENDGDYNNDGVVDVADYVMWQKTLNEPAVPAGSGADGDGDGTIDQDDYDHWFERFGTMPAGSGGHAAVPEPAASVLVAFALSYLVTSRCLGTREE
jgi:hypothetical protein